MRRYLTEALCGHLMRGANVLDYFGNPWWLFPYRAYLFCVFVLVVLLTAPYRGMQRDLTKEEINAFGIGNINRNSDYGS